MTLQNVTVLTFFKLEMTQFFINVAICIICHLFQFNNFTILAFSKTKFSTLNDLPFLRHLRITCFEGFVITDKTIRLHILNTILPLTTYHQNLIYLRESQ
jgi:hypothetical protein